MSRLTNEARAELREALRQAERPLPLPTPSLHTRLVDIVSRIESAANKLADAIEQLETTLAARP